MAHPRELGIFRIGRTEVDRDEVKRWLDFIGVSEGFELPEAEAVSDPALLVALAGKRCYMSFEPGLNPNVNKVRQDYVEYIDNVMSQRHGSVFEHAVFNYAIEGVSRVFTAEMNRHRAGWAISEGSLRFIRFTEIPYVLPESLRPAPGDTPEAAEIKAWTAGKFQEAFAAQERVYGEMVARWGLDVPGLSMTAKKKATSTFRRIVGMGVATGGVWSGNVRALRFVFAQRAAPDAEEEIARVFSLIVADMAQREPALFGDFHQNEHGFWVPKYHKI